MINEEELLDTYFEDYKEFGNLTKYIYEDIFSEIIGENISFNDINCLLTEAPFALQMGSDVMKMGKEYAAEKALGPMTQASTLKWANAFEKAMNNPAASEGLLMKFGKKVSDFFGKLNIANFKNLLTKGVRYVSNPANLPTVLGSTGGIVLLMLIIKSLRKRKLLNNFPHLMKAEKKIKQLNRFNEEDDFEFEQAKAQIMLECKTNKKLKKLILGEKETFNY